MIVVVDIVFTRQPGNLKSQAQVLQTITRVSPALQNQMHLSMQQKKGLCHCQKNLAVRHLIQYYPHWNVKGNDSFRYSLGIYIPTVKLVLQRYFNDFWKDVDFAIFHHFYEWHPLCIRIFEEENSFYEVWRKWSGSGDDSFKDWLKVDVRASAP